MIKRSFFCLSKPLWQYEQLGSTLPEIKSAPLPAKVRLFIDTPFDRKDNLAIKRGDRVNKGQKLSLYRDSEAYTTAPISGTIGDISPFQGDYNRECCQITLSSTGEDKPAEAFVSKNQETTWELLFNFLQGAPGSPPLHLLADPEQPIHTIVINALDHDLLSLTAQYVISTRVNAIKRGIEILKKVTPVTSVFLIVPREQIQGFGHIEAELRAVDMVYPAGLPKNIMHSVLNRPIPAGMSCEDLGFSFFSVEGVASIGEAFDKGRIPRTKIITLVDKEGRSTLLSAIIGTPVGDLFDTVGISLQDRDQIIMGGPMTGSALFSKEHPVEPNTDTLMVLDKKEVVYASDYPCINCGECVRACPVKIPVNMLVRFLEAGLYQQAADDYDLYCCIDCGLCSVVCTSKIPIFQYIQLSKYELKRIDALENVDE